MKSLKTKLLYTFGIAIIAIQGFTLKENTSTPEKKDIVNRTSNGQKKDVKLMLFNASGFADGITMRSADISGLEKTTRNEKDSGIKFRTESNDARLVLLHFQIESSKYKSLHIKFSKQPFRRFEILHFFFITDTDKNWGKDKGSSTTIVEKADETVINLELIPLWKGKIIGTRINFGQVKGSDVTLEEIYYSKDPASTPVK